MKMITYYLLCFTCLIYSATANLICNGDFESYKLTQSSTDSAGKTQKFQYVPSNLSCWYDPSGSTLEVVNVAQKLPHPTQALEFVSYTPHTVCQNLSLQVNGTYQLNFTMIEDPILTSGSMIAVLDGTYLGNATFVSPNYVINKSITFKSNKSSSVLCFNTKQTYAPLDFLSPFQNSPQLDNVTLVMTIPPPTTNTTNTTNTTTNTTSNTTTNTTNTTSSNTTTNTTSNTTTNTTNTTSNTTTTNTTTTNTTTNTTSNTTNNTTTNTTNSTSNNTSTNTTSNTTATNTTTNTTNTTTTTTTNTTTNPNPTNTTNTTNNTTSPTTTNPNPNPTTSTNTTSTNTTSNQTTLSTTNTTPSTNLAIKRQQVYLTIKLISKTCTYDNSIVLTSDFKPEWYGFTIDLFFITVVNIRNQIQKNVIYEVSDQGYLIVTLYPEEIYDSLNPKDVVIYYPGPLEMPEKGFHLDIVVNGKSVIFVKLSTIEIKALKTVDPISRSMVRIVYEAYLILNSSGCSYFVLTLIGFWNLSLMYSFLMVSALPMFSLNFINQLLTILYSRVSIKATLYSVLKLSPKDSLLDFVALSPEEKVPDFRKEFQWFNSFGITSNALNNNFESFFLLGFSLLKFLLYKLLVSRLPHKYQSHLAVSWLSLFHKFVEEVSGFAPFFTISAVHTIFLPAEPSSFRRLNTILQVLIFSLMLFLPLLSFVLKKVRLARLSARTRQLKWKQVRLNHFKSLYSYTWMLFCVALPVFLILGVKVLFLLAITPLLLFRAVLVLRHVRLMRWNEKLAKLSETIIWITYHCTFMFYCLIDIIPSLEAVNMPDQVRVCGFVVIICIFGGGILDLLFSVIRILIQFYRFVKKIAKACCQAPCEQHQLSNVTKPKTDQKLKTQSKSKKLVKIQFTIEINQQQILKQTLEAMLTKRYRNEFNPSHKQTNAAQNLQLKAFKTGKTLPKSFKSK